MSEDKIALICPPWPGRNKFIEIRKLSCSKCKCDVAVAAVNLPIVSKKDVTIFCEDCLDKLKAAGEEIQMSDKSLRSIGDLPTHLHPCAFCSEPYECWCEFPDLVFGDEFQVCPACRAKVA